MGIGLMALLSLLRPFGAVKAPRVPTAFLSGAQANSEVLRVLERSCQNCHSDRTEWPWYSYIAPLSWMVEYDVHQGRSHMNLSHWDEYPPDKQRELLARIATAVRSREMPLPRYARVHPDAKLSDTEVDLVYQWARSARGRVKPATPVSTGRLFWPVALRRK
jgi:hypothetical protein